MYIWNVKRLAEELKTGEMSQKTKMNYLMLMTLSIIVLLEKHASYWQISLMANFDFFAKLIIAIIGFFLCFEANKSGDNKDFIDRMLCLSVPIGFRVFLLDIILTPVIRLIIYPSLSTNALVHDLYLLFLNIGIRLIFLFLLRSYILDISGANRKNDTIAPPIE